MADNARRIAGTAQANIDGVTIPVVGTPTWRVATVTRESLVGMDGPHGYSEKPVTGFIAFQARDTRDILVQGYQEMTNVTVTLILANGKRVTGTQMWNTEAVEVDSSEATLNLRFEGIDVRETL